MAGRTASPGLLPPPPARPLAVGPARTDRRASPATATTGPRPRANWGPGESDVGKAGLQLQLGLARQDPRHALPALA
eukprot:11099493-Alexandrium_andersonii.AAC.1